jgi:DNA-binding SARP family transcriptional activator
MSRLRSAVGQEGRVEFRLLGPVEVRDGDAPVPIGGSKPRALLAALLLDLGTVVPAQRLVDVVWGEAPPDTARGLVQTYVSTLRRALHRPGHDELILTRPPGYLLRAEPAELDLVRFGRDVAAGREAARVGRYEDAARLLRQALSVWRGSALGGVDSELLASEAARLDEQRLSVVEERVTADLALRRHEALVPELVGLVGAYPTREGLRRALMLALYRSGRQAEALAAYREGRRVLRDELGVEPGAALRQAHEAILRGHDPEGGGPQRGDDPEDGDHRGGESGTPRVRTRPAQLPPVPADFTGRAAQIAALVDRLAPAPDGAPARQMPVCVITGKGGTGKSTLAVRAGHELADRYPDGQLFASLRGMTDTPAPPEAVLAQFLAALGDADPPATLAERTDRYRSLLAGRRVLVVLDDAASEAQVRPLLPGTGGCAVLVTSRGRLAGLAGADLVELDVLDAGEATAMLARITGAQRVAGEPDAARALVERCGRLPLAVRIVGARLATRRHWTLAHLADRLEDEERRLDELEVGDLQVRASIALSYAALDARARRALRRLGLLGLADFPAWVLGAVLDSGEGGAAEADPVLEHLLDAQLIDFAATDEAGQARYQLHDLLRLYAAERAVDEEWPADLMAAVHRVLVGWLRRVDAISAAYPSGGIALRPGVPSPDHLTGVVPADPRAWFAAEQHALVASVERAAALGLADVAAELASALCGSLFAIDNRFDAWTRTHDAALAAVRRAGNRQAEASLLSEFGQLRYEQDRYAEARTYFVQALAAFRDCADPRGEAATLAAMGTACREQGYLPEALHFLGQARTIFEELVDDAALASTDRVSGSVHLELGDFAAANRDLAAALDGFRRTGSRRGEGMTLRTLSLLHRARGEYQQAADLAGQALNIAHELGDELLAAYSARALAKAWLRLGRYEQARPLLLDALEVCRQRGDRWSEGITLRTLGELDLAEGRLADAEDRLFAAQGTWQALDLPLSEARTLRDLSTLVRRRGDAAGADRLAEEARAIFRQYGAREYAELSDGAEPPDGADPSGNAE